MRMKREGCKILFRNPFWQKEGSKPSRNTFQYIEVFEKAGRETSFKKFSPRMWVGVFLFVIVFFLSNCGYKIGNAPLEAPDGIKSIAVPVFDNYTTEPELGTILAEALKKEILRRGLVRVESMERADAIVRGAITEVKLEPLSFSGHGFTTAYRVRLKVSVKLEKEGEIIWKTDELEKDEQFLVEGQPLDDISTRRRALEKVASDLMEALHTMMFEGF